MELRHLRYFVGVAQYLNYTEASRRLHVAQQRDLRAEPLPVIQRMIDAHVPRDRHHMDRTIR